ncbi:hypothetical protein C8J57DRAFT_1721201 [Mycena rebaudengoi]|nr:hypothetical protein C8J57DRAFT_1721201 [Mycena rebaudengoi]
MSNFSKLNFMVLAATALFGSGVLSGPTNIDHRAAEVPTASIGGHGTTPDAAQVILMNVCMDPNFGNCVSLNFGNVPTGCLAMPAGWNDRITSAQAVAGIVCTLFADPGCTGRSLVVAGNIPDFRPVGMDDLTTSMSCFST